MCCSEETVIQIMPEGYIHYARLNCKECGKYIKWCKKIVMCLHEETVIQTMPEGHVHYARLNCKKCGKYIKWCKKPII
jgi:transcription elongation factor Elf1